MNVASCRYDLLPHFILLLTNWLPDNVIFLRLRGALACPFLGSCGANLRLGRNITFYNPSNIHIGEDVYIAFLEKPSLRRFGLSAARGLAGM